MTKSTVADRGPDSLQSAPTERRTSGYAWYALGVMMVVYMLSFMDRQLLSILAEDIRHDFGLEDAQLGFLYGTSFAIFYALMGIPLGRLADSWHRGRLMALGLTLWSGMTILSGFAGSYSLLALARIGVGIGEASASPAAFSLLGDYFPRERRALANSIYSAGLYIGMGLSLPLGGAIAQGWDAAYGLNAPLGLRGWQAAFVIIGTPGLLVALWVLSLREPARRDASGEVAPPSTVNPWRDFGSELISIVPPFTLLSASRIPGGFRTNIFIMAGVALAMSLLMLLTGDIAQWAAYGVGVYAIASWVQVLRFRDPETFRLIWGSRTMLLAILGFGSLAVITYGFGFWAAPFAVRTYGVDLSSVGLAIGVPGAIASALGVIAGGRLSDWWQQRDPRGRVFACMIAAVAPVPLIYFMFNAATFTVYVYVSPIVFFFANLWAGSAVAVYQDLVLPRMYGIVAATYLVGSTMIGLALGPYCSGKVATFTGSLRAGMYSLFTFSVISFVALWLVAQSMAVRERTKAIRGADPAVG